MKLEWEIFCNWYRRQFPTKDSNSIYLRQLFVWLTEGKNPILEDGRVLKTNEKRTKFFAHKKS